MSGVATTVTVEETPPLSAASVATVTEDWDKP
jgi:hypothetical protein